MLIKVLSVLVSLTLGGFLALVVSMARVDAGVRAASTYCPIAISQPAVARLLVYDRDLDLTPRQNKLVADVLDKLPSTCMRGHSATSRCCGCNLGRATYGLAKYLLVVKGMDVQHVRAGVQAWQASLTPHGFAGAACPSVHCYTGFKEGGCGGVYRDLLVY